MELRPYQKDCLHHIESLTDQDMMVKLPCGAGKTEIFIRFVSNFIKNNSEKKVLILLNKVLLLEQTRRRFLADGQDCGVVCGTLGEDDTSESITVATIQTIYRNETIFDLVIVDEAHRADSSTYINYLNSYAKKIVRFTATPFTSKGYLYGENLPIKDLAFEMSLTELTDLDVLVGISFKKTEEEFDTSSLPMVAGDYNLGALEELVKDADKIQRQIRDALPRIKDRKKIVWVCVGINHAKAVQSILQLEGERASIIHSDLSINEKKNEIENFELGDARHLVSITIVAEGYDYPPVDSIIMMRPTRSPVLYVQVVGRGLRKSEGKNNCLVLDYGRVVKTLGHPNKPVIGGQRPTLNSKSSDEEKVVLICPLCQEMYFTKVDVCGACLHIFVVKEVKEAAKSLTVKAWGSSEIEVVYNVIGWNIDNDAVSHTGKSMIKVKYKVRETMFGHAEYFMKDGKGKYFTDKFILETQQFTRMPLKLRLRKEDSSEKFFRTVKREYF